MPRMKPPVPVGQEGEEMRRMTITEGLAELKTLGKRINKAIYTEYIWSAKKADMTEESNAKYKEIAQANLSSVEDLIANRNAIKAAIVKSNAITMVKIGSEEMTVADAIERKTSIEFERELLREWKDQYTQTKNNVDAQNRRVQERIDNMLSQIASSQKSDIEEAQKVMSETYMANNGWDIFDPLDIKAKIDEYDKRIDEFEKNVDIALSMSNAVTTIEI